MSCMARLQEVAFRRGRRRLQPVSWRRFGVRPMVIVASVNLVRTVRYFVHIVPYSYGLWSGTQYQIVLGPQRPEGNVIPR